MKRAGFLVPMLLAACAQGGTAPEPGAPAEAKPVSNKTKTRAATDRVIGFEVPEAWVEEEPANFMRRAQYRVKDKQGEAADGFMVIFHFRVASPVDQNVRRWVGQMGAEPAEPEKFEGVYPVTFVDLAGDYMGDSQTDPIEDARMLSAIVEAPDGQWFFKLIGPAGTVGDWKSEYVRLLKSAKR